MQAIQRQQQILARVRRERSVPVQSLIRELKISPATVRRDLSLLEKNGKVLRTHGAVLDPQGLGGEPSFAAKRARVPEVKRNIGRAVADRIAPGSHVYIDAGSSCMEAGIALLARGDCHLFTNSVPLLYTAGDYQQPVTAIGGTLRSLSGALVGAPALAWLDQLHFDVAVLGASSLRAEIGCFTTELSEAAVKKAAAAHASRVYLAAAAEKLSASAPVGFLPWTEVDVWFTDSLENPAYAAAVDRETHFHEIIQTEVP